MQRSERNSNKEFMLKLEKNTSDLKQEYESKYNHEINRLIVQLNEQETQINQKDSEIDQLNNEINLKKNEIKNEKK